MKGVVEGKTILVTGGTGSIGSEIVKQSLQQGAGRVIVMSRDEIKHFLMKRRIRDNRLQTIVADVRDYTSVRKAFDLYDIDVVYHAAAMKHVVMCEDFPEEAVKTNVFGTQNVVDLAIRYNVSKMVAISTDKAACPVNTMGATKFLSERIVLNANRMTCDDQVFCCVRFGNVASSRGSVIPVFVDALMRGDSIQVTDLGVTRFVMEIPEAVGLVLKAGEHAQGGEIFILKMKAFRLEDLVDVLVKNVAPKQGWCPKGAKVEVTGLVRGEKLHEDLLNDIELSNVYEAPDMYVVLPSDATPDRYPGVKLATNKRYNSADVEPISKTEIQRIVAGYLHTLGIGL